MSAQNTTPAPSKSKLKATPPIGSSPQKLENKKVILEINDHVIMKYQKIKKDLEALEKAKRQIEDLELEMSMEQAQVSTLKISDNMGRSFETSNKNIIYEVTAFLRMRFNQKTKELEEQALNFNIS